MQSVQSVLSIRDKTNQQKSLSDQIWNWIQNWLDYGSRKASVHLQLMIIFGSASPSSHSVFFHLHWEWMVTINTFQHLRNRKTATELRLGPRDISQGCSAASYWSELLFAALKSNSTHNGRCWEEKNNDLSWQESAQTPELWFMWMSREAADWWKRSVMTSAHGWPSNVQMHHCSSWAELWQLRHSSFAHQDLDRYAIILFKTKSKVTSELNRPIPLFQTSTQPWLTDQPGESLRTY